MGINMPDSKWTEQQEEAISENGTDVLVSAGAGSGKTAVLVERILRKIMREHGADVDRMLIVTFTRAAAAQMRERIEKGIAELIKNNPGNEELKRQHALVASARICTIDSFCLYVVQNYFSRLDNLSPDFRIMDSDEQKLILKDAMDVTLEAAYENGDESFFEFADLYAQNRNDKNIEKIVLKLYNMAESMPEPEKWLNEIGGRPYDEFRNIGIYETGKMLDDSILVLNEAIKISTGTAHLENYASTLESDIDVINGLKNTKDFANVVFDRLKPVKSKEIEADPFAEQINANKEKVKNLRDGVKETVKWLADRFFFESEQKLMEEQQVSANMMAVPIKLALEFIKNVNKEKASKNVLDFSDVSHLALKILLSGEEPSAAACELRQMYDEIIVDEYQDSSAIQEKILTAVCGSGHSNMYMVGDVKQSIYRFRLARPDIFIGKAERYLNGQQGHLCIMNSNFRSRVEVLDGVDEIFTRLMHREFGGVEYDSDASLKCGAKYIYRDDDHTPYLTELLLTVNDDDEKNISSNSENNADKDNRYRNSDADVNEDTGSNGADHEEDLDAIQAEARAIAKRILELTDKDKGLYVTGKDDTTGEAKLRICRFGDIVILLRSMTASNIYIKELEKARISAVAELRQGYFEAMEVGNMMDMLRVIDNPLQDIPFAGVLHSAFVKLTPDEMAEIRFSDTDGEHCFLYDDVIKYVKDGSRQELKKKLADFIEIFEILRNDMKTLPVYMLIKKIYDLTGFDSYIKAMPDAARRCGNLNLLMEKARKFEQTSYHGLFEFIRYTGRLLENEVDYGEAQSVLGADTVRIMTIHSSKGLEFPVVFVAHMNGGFNEKEYNDPVLCNPEFGIGAQYIDSKLRIKNDTLALKTIRHLAVTDGRGEELRVLYVACTRAKEKLILSAFVDKSEEDVSQNFENDAELLESMGRYPYQKLLKYKNYLNMAGPVFFLKGVKCAPVRFIKKSQLAMVNCAEDSKPDNKNEMVNRNVFLSGEMINNLQIETDEKKISELSHEISIREKYAYPYAHAIGLPFKLSVSEIKRKWEEEDGEAVSKGYNDKVILENTLGNAYNDKIEMLPGFLKDRAEITGADLGTAVHMIMENLDFTAENNYESIKALADNLVKKGFIREEYSGKIDLNGIVRFLDSDLYKRMKKAALNNKLYREQPFVMRMESCDDKGETYLVQGIIDAYFEEDGECVIVDYKTDKLTEDELLRKYAVQLNIYAKAVGAIKEIRIKEKILYSFNLSKALLLGKGGP